MSTTRDSMRELMKLQERMNQLFEQSFSKGGAPEEVLPGSDWSPLVDIQEMPDRIVLRADLPGIPIEHLELKIENERLILKGERPFDSTGRKEDYHRIERPSGRFLRTFALPRSIQQSGIRAEMKNGVLEVVLPKGTETRAKPIKVEVR